jgi:hypothetical protein
VAVGVVVVELAGLAAKMGAPAAAAGASTAVVAVVAGRLPTVAPEAEPQM